MKKTLLTLIVALPVLALTQTADAQVGRSSSGYNSINKGAFDLSVDNFLLFTNSTVKVPDSDGDEISTSRLRYELGVSPKYFVIKNLAVGANVNYAFGSSTDSATLGGETTETTSSENGFVGYATADYYLRMANSFFLVPGVGAGFFSSTREEPVAGDGNLKMETDLSGFAGRGSFGAVFYAGRQWNLRAGVTATFRSGNAKVKDAEGDGTDFTNLDAAFTAGMGYTF